MKRDMDLLRELLLKLESFPKEPGAIYGFAGDGPEVAVDGASPDQIIYHLELLSEAGFIESPGLAGREILFKRLTWSGHDFLDSVRDPKVWAKTKQGVGAAGGFTIDLLKDLAKGFMKKQVEEYTGMKSIGSTTATGCPIPRISLRSAIIRIASPP